MSLAAQLQHVVNNRAVQVFTQAEQSLLSDLDSDVPFKTGKLKRSRQSSASFSTTRASVTVTYPPDYAKFTDEGTRPHKIVGRPLLAFQWRGKLVIVHSVNHPGTKGTRWWTKRANESSWRNFLQRAAQ